VLLSAFFVYRTLNTNKVKYKNFLHEVGKKVKQSRYRPGVAQRVPGS